MQTKTALAFLAAAAAFVLPPLGASPAEGPTSAPVAYRLAAGEHLSYESRMIVNGPQLKARRLGRYTVDVDPHDPSRAALRVQQDGKPNPAIAITIKPDGSWTRPDGRPVPSLGVYDPNVMCGHPSPTVRSGESWSCHIDGVSQYLAGAPAEPGEVHVAVAKILAPATVELTVSYKGDAHRETIVDDDTHADVLVLRQTIRMTDVIFENGVVTSIADHSQIITSFGGSPPSTIDVTATKNLVDHRPR